MCSGGLPVDGYSKTQISRFAYDVANAVHLHMSNQPHTVRVCDLFNHITPYKSSNDILNHILSGPNSFVSNIRTNMNSVAMVGTEDEATLTNTVLDNIRRIR